VVFTTVMNRYQEGDHRSQLRRSVGHLQLTRNWQHRINAEEIKKPIPLKCGGVLPASWLRPQAAGAQRLLGQLARAAMGLAGNRRGGSRALGAGLRDGGAIQWGDQPAMAAIPTPASKVRQSPSMEGLNLAAQ